MLHGQGKTQSPKADPPDGAKSTALKHWNWSRVFALVAKQNGASNFDQ